MIMGEVQLQGSTSSALNARYERSTSLRRARPPDISIIKNEDRVPLRVERAMKRESKIGLRSIFARSKSGKYERDVEETTSSKIAQRPAGIRASLADLGNWPYKLHSARSEASLISTLSGDSRPTSSDLLSPPRSRQGSASTDKFQPIAAQSGRVVAATWDPPPLFQVYPQAVKHATLRACNVSMEALVRLSGTKSNKLIQGTIASSMVGLERVEDLGIEGKSDIGKRKQRVSGLRNSLDWTDKIFVLVTSGYLLQYAAEGSFNRVPEKILQLTRTSAAYASDLIPGKHWVLQVASTTEADGNTFADPKSFRSKLSIRGIERRQVPNMLLVFENPESMDDWLATLRKEIECLGGKKRLSETGTLEPGEQSTELEAQPSHRAVIVRDPDRFSRVITRDFSYTQENALNDPSENDPAFSSPRRVSTYTIDNGSPTASLVSADGQHLDNLRDSSSSHRFSYISSGQRTIITSRGSSPACSPTRASFCSQGEDPQVLPSMPEVRLRPNAAAIVNRRQSMQALISSFEAPVGQGSHPYSNNSSTMSHGKEHPILLGAPSVPNFSVPHAVSKRFSLNAPVASVPSHLPQALDHDRGTKASRRLPPTALSMARPLSIVIDQPSPRSPRSPNSLSRSFESCQSPSLETSNTSTGLGIAPEQIAWDQTKPPRRYSSIASSRANNKTEVNIDVHDQSMPSHVASHAIAADDIKPAKQMPRAATSLDMYDSRRELSAMPPNKSSSYKRSTFMGDTRCSQNLHHSLANVNEWKPKLADSDTPHLVPTPSCSPKRSAPSLRASSSSQLSPTRFLTIDAQAKLITARRSMPQLTEGPPLAPPPSHALPPIPRKPSTTLRGIKA
ncbi:hypothetical protein F5Y19DRAFT_295909 [Xylariaceae sp. FL1651]|nr:hypothetical protein F5Y19DRAFT_295909 [Xylariaceae sp. FL1651]